MQTAQQPVWRRVIKLLVIAIHSMTFNFLYLPHYKRICIYRIRYAKTNAIFNATKNGKILFEFE